MPSIAIQSAFVAVSAATTTGVLTVTSTDYLFPGSIGWVNKDDGSAQALVKIVARLSSTTIQVRKYANNDPNSPPNYGLTDMTAFNGASHICIDPQAVPVDPAYSVPVIP